MNSSTGHRTMVTTATTKSWSTPVGGSVVKADTNTPSQVFGNQIRYVVPLFQRPYVWTEQDQWQPLWNDVESLADRILEAPGGFGAPPTPPHFLGAIVIEQALGPVRLIN